MVDVDPFLTTLSVMVDDFCTASLPTESPPSHTRRSVAVRCLRWRSLGRGRSGGRERGPRKLHRHHHRCYLAY